MSDERADVPSWLPMALAEQWREASEEAMDQQLGLFQQLLDPGQSPVANGMSQWGRFGTGAATFKTRVQSGGRISIPDTEREALDIQEGDIVQTIVIPVKRDREEE